MLWLILAANIVFFCGSQVIVKAIVNKLNVQKAVCLQLLSAAVIAGIYNFISEGVKLEITYLPIAVVGFLQVWQIYFQWKAYRYSLSKSILFFPLSGVITVVLAAVFLGESGIYNAVLILGVVSLFSSAILIKKGDSKSDKKEISAIAWLLYLVGSIAIGGVAVFMIKVFSLRDAPIGTFLFYWYTSSFIGSILVMVLTSRKEDKKQIFGKTAWLIPLSGLAIMLNLATIHILFQMKEVVIVEPLRYFFGSVMVVFLGWFVFKEIKSVKKMNVLGFALGILGAGLVIFSQ